MPKKAVSILCDGSKALLNLFCSTNCVWLKGK